MNRVYIVILNWNGWQDTIECLESVFRLDYPDFRVVICNNDSQDGSLDHIKAWAAGRISANTTENDSLRRFTFPPVAKPIAYREYNRRQAEKGGNGDDAMMVLIQTGGNLGFSGGNNVGIRYALARNDFSNIWLLNNDTIVKPDALLRMVQRINEKPGAGICGSLMPYYHAPEIIWAAGGGALDLLRANITILDNGKYVADVSPRGGIEARMDYVAGASMFVSADFLSSVGLLSEDYFLYFEELDWCLRGRKKFSLAYADAAIVYHKVGMSTSKWDVGAGKAQGFYYKSLWRFTMKFFPLALPLVFLYIAEYRLRVIFLFFRRMLCSKDRR